MVSGLQGGPFFGRESAGSSGLQCLGICKHASWARLCLFEEHAVCRQTVEFRPKATSLPPFFWGPHFMHPPALGWCGPRGSPVCYDLTVGDVPGATPDVASRSFLSPTHIYLSDLRVSRRTDWCAAAGTVRRTACHLVSQHAMPAYQSRSAGAQRL